MSYLLLVIACCWAVYSLIVLRETLFTPLLPARDELPRGEPPRVSVILAARDEAGRIEETLRRLLAQRDVDLQMVAVDDRSTDGTTDILRRLAAEDQRVEIVRVDKLPPGWLGKVHACHLGAGRAEGDWLLFTDADVHMQPDLVDRAVATAQRDGADHLPLWPGISTPGTLARGCILAWSQSLITYAPPSSINRDRGRRALGVGAFNLVRRAAYEAIGGHEPLKMDVVDDVKLGMLLRRAGFRQRIYIGCDDMEVEWAHSLREMVKINEKNWFASVDYSVPRATAILLVGSLLTFGALLGPLVDPVFGGAAFAAWYSTAVPSWRQARVNGWPWYTALVAPLGFFVFLLTGLNSTFRTLRDGGVRWRDTFYPLAELRAGLAR